MTLLSDDAAALLGLRETVARMLVAFHRNYPRLAALPYEIRHAVEQVQMAMAAPWLRVLQDLQDGDVIVVHVPPGEDPHVVQETYHRIVGAVPKGVIVMTETTGLHLDRVPAPEPGDVILVRMRKRPNPEEQVALGQMTRAVFGSVPTVVVQDDTHDILQFNETEMHHLGWVRVDG